MANKNIFCNAPYFHTQIEADGTFSFCCSAKGQAAHQFGYDINKFPDFNIKKISIKEWFNSPSMKHIRQTMMGDKKFPSCASCYVEEEFGNESYRIVNNWRSMIFTRSAFDHSFEQSPHNEFFVEASKENTRISLMPIDFHVDLGNDCNIACKFCKPSVSTTIATNHKLTGLMPKSVPSRIAWTDDTEVWQRFMHELLSIENLGSIHFMGGEPTMSPRLEEFVDFFIKHKKTDFAISFVTNGTKYDRELVNKLSKFLRVDIDISIESILDNNFYIRQGLKKEVFHHNVKLYLTHRSDNFGVTLKPALGSLQFPTYPELIEYFLENNITSESNTIFGPAYLRIDVIPYSLREMYFPKFEALLDKLKKLCDKSNSSVIKARSVDSNVVNLYNELMTVYNMIQVPDHPNAEQLRKELIKWLTFWDDYYEQDARTYYPEWTEFLESYGYKKV